MGMQYPPPDKARVRPGVVAVVAVVIAQRAILFGEDPLVNVAYGRARSPGNAVRLAAKACNFAILAACNPGLKLGDWHHQQSDMFHALKVTLARIGLLLEHDATKPHPVTLTIKEYTRGGAPDFKIGWERGHTFDLIDS